jgi:hypothetical protein
MDAARIAVFLACRQWRFDVIMATLKRVLLAVTIVSFVWLPGAASLSADPRPMKLLLKPTSTVPPSEVLRHLSSHCPNVGLTRDWKKSDYELEAGGFSGAYHFTVFAHGGDAVYSTNTERLGNAVKDVCHWLNGPGSAPK